MARPNRDHVMLTALATTTALELVNWRQGVSKGSNDGTICKFIRIVFRTDTPAGRWAFRAALGTGTLWLCGHVES